MYDGQQVVTAYWRASKVHEQLSVVGGDATQQLTAMSCSPSGLTMSSSAATKLKSIPTLMFCTAAPKYLHIST